MTVTSGGAIRTIIQSKVMETVKTILDVGGGDATVATSLVKEYPNLKATVFNLPNSAELARSRVIATNSIDKVNIVEGLSVTNTQSFVRLTSFDLNNRRLPQG
jgi:hypothetical protein